MKPRESLDLRIAIARVVLSVFAIVSVYVDPTVPNLTPGFALTGGFLAIDRYALAVLCVHLSYGAALLVIVQRGLAGSGETLATKLLDVFFAVLVAVFTEGATSPAYVFFTFAILATACREGFRATAVVIAGSVAAYLLLVLVSSAGTAWTYLMRPIYLAITGSLIGFLGQQRVDFEARVRKLESAAERRDIARSLHDGYVQALAGTMLRLETSRELIRRGESSRALGELTELQAGVTRELDDVRQYIRSLVDEAPANRSSPNATATPITVEVGFCAPAGVVEEILQVLLEATRNIRRHAFATSASVRALEVDHRAIRISIDDDGVGFRELDRMPWSIASRVREIGGQLRVVSEPRMGAHLEIDMPLDRPS